MEPLSVISLAVKKLDAYQCQNCAYCTRGYVRPQREHHKVIGGALLAERTRLHKSARGSLMLPRSTRQAFEDSDG